MRDNSDVGIFDEVCCHVHMAVTMASRRKMTDYEIEHFIQLWRYDIALWDTFMK